MEVEMGTVVRLVRRHVEGILASEDIRKIYASERYGLGWDRYQLFCHPMGRDGLSCLLHRDASWEPTSNFLGRVLNEIITK